MTEDLKAQPPANRLTGSPTLLNSMKPTKLSDLLEAVDFDSDERVTKVDLQEGVIVSFDTDILSALEEDDQETLDSLPEWQQEEIEEARVVVSDSGERFINTPSKFDFHEYRHMERFISTVADEASAEELFRAIKGRGAFRHFKDTASRLGLLEDWHLYREQALKRFVTEWAEWKQVPIVDDTLQK